MNARCLIVNADDLGLTVGHNRAVVDAHRTGILTSASLLACGEAFDDAVARVQELPRLGIGVHLTLLEGAPVRPSASVPTLVGENGHFGLRYGALFWRLGMGQIALDQVRDEWRAQVDTVVATGLRVTHLDSHKHVHMHPRLLGVALLLAAEVGIRRMRLSRPPRLASGPKAFLLGLLALWARSRMDACGIRHPDVLFGLAESGAMDVDRLCTAISRPWRGVRELMMHPAYRSEVLSRLAARGYRWIARYRFEDELEALRAARVRATLDTRGVELGTYEAL